MPVPVTSQHVTGFLVGLGVAAAGFYFYKKNQRQVDEWLRQQGISIAPGGLDYGAMALEDLVREKERLEDLIAEREHAATQEAARPRARTQRKRPATKPRRREPAKAAA